jgi:hypothetical protein
MSRRTLLFVVAVALAAVVALGLAALLSRSASAPSAAPDAQPTIAQPSLAGADKKDAAPPPKVTRADEGLARRSIVIEKNGVKRISCVGACALEAKCELRDEDACIRGSCEGDVRTANRSDFCFAQAESCADAVACTCNESCWKRGECAGDHGSDVNCEAACRTLLLQRPAAIYDENRCVIESACGAIAACARLD